nr:hypothetical protein [Novosphingobium sp. G106]
MSISRWSAPPTATGRAKRSERIEIPGELLEREREERGHLLETLADFDDALLETLLMDETPDPSLVMADLAIDTATGKVVPTCCSARRR